jgi:hypothetical protein
MVEYRVPVEGTTITLAGDDKPVLELTARLMEPQEDQSSLTGPDAHKLVKALEAKDLLDLSLLEVVIEEKGLTPVKSAEWLMEGDNKFAAIALRNNRKGIKVPDHTV